MMNFTLLHSSTFHLKLLIQKYALWPIGKVVFPLNGNLRAAHRVIILTVMVNGVKGDTPGGALLFTFSTRPSERKSELAEFRIYVELVERSAGTVRTSDAAAFHPRSVDRRV